MRFGAADLCAVLEQQLPPGATGLVVGVSGGVDSACLLAAIAQREALPSGALPVRAVHVDHGLQAASAALRESASALCARFEIPFTIIAVSVDTGGGVSVEAAARAARYAALGEALLPGECLLTAHHQQDQAETVLLQLMRGAGLKGLASMPARRRLGAGWHIRPLLGVAHRDLLEFGRTRGVAAADDPMNRDPRFERAYLRRQLWPLIERRWPGAAASLSRAARHLSEAQTLLDESAARHVARLRDGDELSVTGLRALTKLEQINALRYWLSSLSIEPPSAARLTEGLRQILGANPDHVPAVIWGSHALRRYRDRVFLTAATPPAIDLDREWPRAAGAGFDLGSGLGSLRFVRQNGGLDARRLPERLAVRRRRGGEVMKLAARARTQSVQHLCQSQGVLPWMRDALPLVYAGDALVAIGDLWHDVRWRVGAGEPGLSLVWDASAPLLT